MSAIGIPQGRRSGIVPLLGAYLVFGAFWGAWAAAFPSFLAARSLSLGAVSLGFTGMSLTSIAVMTWVSPRLDRLPRACGVALALGVHGAGNAFLALGHGPALWLGFAVTGAGTGLIDVCVNAAASEIERAARRPTLQWVHASYGAGGVLGSLCGAAAITTGVSYPAVLVGAALVQGAAGVAVLCHRGLMTRRGATSQASWSVGILRAHPYLLVPALIVLSAFFVEGSMDVWSVVFVRRAIGSALMAGAAAFAAFALAITVGRSFAARVLFGLGYRRTVLVSGAVSVVCALVAVLATDPVVAAVAFLGLGLGLSPAAPAAYGMTEGSGAPAGLAVGAVTTLGYSGFVFGPPVMGWLGDHAGLRPALAVLALAAVGILCGGTLARREQP